jgi:prepilin-type N-terminal cleavage/methylation domain-containing protein
MPRPITAPHQSGFTLIEVMVAMALVMVLMVGMNALWTQVASQFDDLVYRQKAIFRLNGEMERLVALYNSSDTSKDPTFNEVDTGVDYTQNIPTYAGSFLSTTPNSSYPYGSTQNRRVFNKTLAPSYILDAGTSTDMAAFTNTPSADGTTIPTQSIYTNILMTGTGSSRRNLVWLDQVHQIVGQLSWDFCLLPNTYGTSDSHYGMFNDCKGNPATATVVSPCYQTACYFLTVYIDYPFRFDATNKVGVPIPGIPVETITAETIVGKQRKS